MVFTLFLVKGKRVHPLFGLKHALLVLLLIYLTPSEMGPGPRSLCICSLLRMHAATRCIETAAAAPTWLADIANMLYIIGLCRIGKKYIRSMRVPLQRSWHWKTHELQWPIKHMVQGKHSHNVCLVKQ